MLRGAAAPLYDAIAIQRAGAAGPLDGYLAGLAAYATIIGLTGPSRWRTALWLTIGVYAIVTLATASITVLSLVITLLLGRAIGLGVRYAAGEWSQRPTAEEIAAGLGSAGHPVTRDAAHRPGGQRVPALRRDGTRRLTASTCGCSTAIRRWPGHCTGSTAGCGCRDRCAGTGR